MPGRCCLLRHLHLLLMLLWMLLHVEELVL
jgi:hypothetical protein